MFIPARPPPESCRELNGRPVQTRKSELPLVPLRLGAYAEPS